MFHIYICFFLLFFNKRTFDHYSIDIILSYTETISIALFSIMKKRMGTCCSALKDEFAFKNLWYLFPFTYYLFLLPLFSSPSSSSSSSLSPSLKKRKKVRLTYILSTNPLRFKGLPVSRDKERLIGLTRLDMETQDSQSTSTLGKNWAGFFSDDC